MPRDGAIIFGDLIGKLDVLRVACSKCERAGRYRLDRLIKDRGRDAKVINWLRLAHRRARSEHPRVRHSPPKEKPGTLPGFDALSRANQRNGCPVEGAGGGTDDDCAAGCGGLRGGTARD